MVSELVLITFFVTSLQLMVPILFASLGEILVERSGVLNVGIEGVMLIGAFTTALVGIETGSVMLGMLAGFGSGLLCGAALSALYVRVGTDQVVTGLMFNILAIGLTALLRDQLIGGQVGPILRGISVPVLNRIRFIGDVLAQQNALLWVGIGLTPVVAVALYRTWWGLQVRAAGERPGALAASGHDVWRTRYAAVILGCGLSALGGTALVLSSSGGFVPNMVAGRGSSRWAWWCWPGGGPGWRCWGRPCSAWPRACSSWRRRSTRWRAFPASSGWPRPTLPLFSSSYSRCRAGTRRRSASPTSPAPRLSTDRLGDTPTESRRVRVTFSYVHGDRMPLPDDGSFAEFTDPSISAVVSVDMHRGHLEDSPECPCPRPGPGRSWPPSTGSTNRRAGWGCG